jgi:hypothetical protein
VLDFGEMWKEDYLLVVVCWACTLKGGAFVGEEVVGESSSSQNPCRVDEGEEEERVRVEELFYSIECPWGIHPLDPHPAAQHPPLYASRGELCHLPTHRDEVAT